MGDRPLLAGDDPETRYRELLAERQDTTALATITVDAGAGNAAEIADAVVTALADHLLPEKEHPVTETASPETAPTEAAATAGTTELSGSESTQGPARRGHRQVCSVRVAEAAAGADRIAIVFQPTLVETAKQIREFLIGKVSTFPLCRDPRRRSR